MVPEFGRRLWRLPTHGCRSGLAKRFDVLCAQCVELGDLVQQQLALRIAPYNLEGAHSGSGVASDLAPCGVTS